MMGRRNHSPFFFRKDGDNIVISSNAIAAKIPQMSAHVESVEIITIISLKIKGFSFNIN